MMKGERDVIRLFAEAIDSGASAALVTVVSMQGSTPRDAGARMIVYADGSAVGTVGGGKLEALSIRDAVKAIGEGSSRKAAYDLKPEGTGMVCMGRVEVFIDVQVRELGLLILGAGHVGERLAALAAAAGVPCDVADERAEFANRESFPSAGRVLVERPDRAVRSAKPDARTYVVIVTRGHELDAECLAAALKSDAAYIGMIGSRSKVPTVFRGLNRKGLHPERDPRVHAPIGLDLGGKSPGAIAVSILAEILKVHHRRGGGHLALRGREAGRG
ncbi:MAG: XdhC/CoxI family protein [Elusimicrobiota bacterium]|jgi:xanthine dehydrogenase accessory factor